MATKPAITIVVRASDPNYSNGPALLVGTPTKIARTSPQQSEGYLVDSPLGDFPVPAQAVNFEENRTDLMLEWVTFGSETADLDAHILESDATGLARLGMLATGSTGAGSPGLVANPNTATVAIEVHADANNDGGEFDSLSNLRSGLLAKSVGSAEGDGSDVGIVRIESDTGGVNGSPRALHVEGYTLVSMAKMVNTAPVGATLQCIAGGGDAGVHELPGGPAYWGVVGTPDGAQDGGLAGLFDSNELSGVVARFRNQNVAANDDIIHVEAPNRAIGIKVSQTGGKRAAVELSSVDSGGSDRGAPLRLVPQTFTIAGESAQDGAIWHQEGSFTNGTGLGEQHHPRFYGQASNWNAWTEGPTCSIEKFVSGNTTGPDSEAKFIILDVEFPDRMTPLSTGSVVVEVSGYCRRTGTGSTNPTIDGYRITVEDFTDTSALIVDDTFDLSRLETGNINNAIRSFFSIKKTYALPTSGPRRFQVKCNRETAANAGLEVTDVNFTVRPLPAGLDEFA